MPSRAVSIRFEELPLRARPLGVTELSAVFGGCQTSGQVCDKVKTMCCLELECIGRCHTEASGGFM